MRWLTYPEFNQSMASFAAEKRLGSSLVGALFVIETARVLPGPGMQIAPLEPPFLDGLGQHRCWFAGAGEVLLCLAQFEGTPHFHLYVFGPMIDALGAPWRVFEHFAELIPGVLEYVVRVEDQFETHTHAVYGRNARGEFIVIYRSPSFDDATAFAALLQAKVRPPRWVVGPFPEADLDLAGPGWGLYRQDDNGNRFLIERRASRLDAELRAAEMEALGHKQMYWVARSDP